MNEKISKYKNYFWLEKPSILFDSLCIIPSKNISEIELLNILTRLIIFISIILLIIGYKKWLLFLITGISIIILIYIIRFYKNEEIFLNSEIKECYICNSHRSKIKESKNIIENDKKNNNLLLSRKSKKIIPKYKHYSM